MEIIVVDNGSTDDTAAVARAHDAEVLLNQDRRRGFVARSRNIGASGAQGQVLLFIDADMVTPPGYLALALDYYHQGFLGVISFLQTAPRPATWVGRIWESRNHHEHTEPVRTINVSSANMFINRRLFDELGGFDEQLRSCEDRDLAFRVTQSGAQCLRLPGPHLIHLGYDRDLKQLIRKEWWRQGSTLDFALKHKSEFRLWRNPLLSVVHLIGAINAGILMFTAAPLLFGASLLLWAFPSILLTMFKSGNLKGADRLALFMLLFIRWNVAGFALPQQLFHLTRRRPG